MKMQHMMYSFSLFMVFLMAGTSLLNAGEISDSLGAYWDFETYTPGSNPAGFPGGNNQGSFADQSSNGNTLYGGILGNAFATNPQSAAGRFGNSFYSTTPVGNNDGALGVAAHSGSLNADAGENFTISVWEKVGIRSTAGSWGANNGRGRSSIFAKVDDSTVHGNNGLHYEINPAQRVTLQTNSDGYAQTSLASTPHLLVDNDKWAHHLIVGSYDGGTGDVSLKTFVNGAHWAALDATVDADVLDNDGYTTIGAVWRGHNGGNATNIHQRYLSWHTDEGFVDDFARFDDLAFTDGEAMAVYNLAEEAALDYDIGQVLKLLDVHRDAAGEVDVDGRTWAFSDDAALFTGGLGEVVQDGDFFLQLADGTGVTTQGQTQSPVVPEPASIAIWSLLGLCLAGYGYRRRSRNC